MGKHAGFVSHALKRLHDSVHTQLLYVPARFTSEHAPLLVWLSHVCVCIECRVTSQRCQSLEGGRSAWDWTNRLNLKDFNSAVAAGWICYGMATQVCVCVCVCTLWMYLTAARCASADGQRAAMLLFCGRRVLSSLKIPSLPSWFYVPLDHFLHPLPVLAPLSFLFWLCIQANKKYYSVVFWSLVHSWLLFVLSFLKALNVHTGTALQCCLNFLQPLRSPPPPPSLFSMQFESVVNTCIYFAIPAFFFPLLRLKIIPSTSSLRPMSSCHVSIKPVGGNIKSVGGILAKKEENEKPCYWQFNFVYSSKAVHIGGHQCRLASSFWLGVKLAHLRFGTSSKQWKNQPTYVGSSEKPNKLKHRSNSTNDDNDYGK